MNTAISQILKRTGLLTASLLLVAQMFLPLTALADGAGSPDACLEKTADVYGSVSGTPDLITKDVGAGNVATGVCIKSGEAMFGAEKHSTVLGNGTYSGLSANGGAAVPACYTVSGVGTQTVTVTRVANSNTCQGLSHIDVIYEKTTDYCDPSQYNIVTNVDNITAEQRASCFTVTPSQKCGEFNVTVIGPVYTINGNPAPYRAQWIYDGETRDDRKNLPATFSEDQNGGTVTVRYLLVGPESDYLTGTGIPNYWDNLLSAPYVIDTDCEDPETPAGSITGHKFNDVNGNGVWEKEVEETLEGFTIELYNYCGVVEEEQADVANFLGLTAQAVVVDECTEKLLDTDVTDENGKFEFPELDAGNYLVCEVQKDGWTQTLPADDACWVVTVEDKECVVDFGNMAKEEGEVLGKVTPQVLANTGTPFAQGLLVGMSILGAASGITYLSRRKQYAS